MKKFVTLLFLLSLGVYASPISSNPTLTAARNVVKVSVTNCDKRSPCAVIKGTAEKLSDAVNNQNIDNNQAVKMIEDSIVPNVNFPLVTQLAVGPLWKSANSQQQQEITQLFKNLLVYQYANALSKFKGAKVTIDSSSIIGAKAQKATVVGLFYLPADSANPTQAVKIEYDLAKIAAKWQIYDVKIDNASLVTTYRNQFASKAPSELITDLKTKVNLIKNL